MPDKLPVLPGQVAFGEKSPEIQAHSSHAVHKAGTQSQAELDEIVKYAAPGHAHSHQAPATLPARKD